MRTLLTLAVLFSLVLILAGGVAVVLTWPAWACVHYGAVAAVAVPSGLEAVADVWALKQT
jgi:hypothetical protein